MQNKKRKPALLNGEIEQFTLKIAGKNHKCNCGCNVFHKPDDTDLDIFKCNCCSYEFKAT